MDLLDTGSTKQFTKLANSILFDEIYKIVTFALAAPTGDNCQHWRFTWNDQTLAVFYDETLGRHGLNNNNHATWLALGALLESVRIGASGFKLDTHETLNLEQWKTQPVAIIEFARCEMKTDFLISEVFRRQTVRQPLRSEGVPDNLLAQIRTIAGSFAKCEVTFSTEKTKTLLNYLTHCDELLWRNRSVLKDFLHWVRLTKKECDTSRDGMPWQTLNIGNRDRTLLRLIRAIPWLSQIFWPLGLKRMVNLTTERLYFAQSLIYSINISDALPNTVVNAGRLANRIWLFLSSEGYKAQPLSIASMTAFDIATGHAPPNTSSTWLEKTSRGYESFKSELSVTENHMPVWAFRAGRPKSDDQIPTSPRINTSERLKVYTK